MSDSRPSVTIAKLSEEQLAEASDRTLGHYDGRAEVFWEGTRDHDVSQNIAALLRHLPEHSAHTILDFGCGPGRDLLRFKELGHIPVGLEGSAEFVKMAREHSGCEVLHQNFLALDLAIARFNGIFANATLFHVPSQELPRVLSELRLSLRPDGVLFTSNPRGSNQEGWSGNRYCCHLDLDTYRGYMTQAGFRELEHYYRPLGKPRAEQPWLASVWRRVD